MTSLYLTLTQELGLTDREIIRELTPANALIVSTIGLPFFMSLLEEIGGQQVYLPGNASEHSRIAQLIGVEAAEKLKDVIGGDQHVTIANNFGLRTLIRLMGYKMIREGCSINGVVAELGVSRSAVKEWRRHVTPDDAQPSKTISQHGNALNIAVTWSRTRRAVAA